MDKNNAFATCCLSLASLTIAACGRGDEVHVIGAQATDNPLYVRESALWPNPEAIPVCWETAGYEEEKAWAREAAAAPTAPEPSRFPEPPPLPRDASLCVVRRFHPDEKAWHTTTYGYDSAARVLSSGPPLRFDAEGRLTTIGEPDSDSFETQSYDARGNIYERLTWQRGQLSEGTRWDDRYEGDPPRLVEQALSERRAKQEPSAPHTRIHYSYDEQGRMIQERTNGPRGGSQRHFAWRNGRIASIRERMDPHPSQPGQVLEAIESFEYDAQHRIAAHVQDGSTPFGEGSLADGKPDQRETFHYDAAGRLERIERDGQAGDVAPEAPDGKPDAVTLLSAACDPLIALAPHLFGFPELFLPNSLRPPLR